MVFVFDVPVTAKLNAKTFHRLFGVRVERLIFIVGRYEIILRRPGVHCA